MAHVIQHAPPFLGIISLRYASFFGIIALKSIEASSFAKSNAKQHKRG